MASLWCKIIEQMLFNLNSVQFSVSENKMSELPVRWTPSVFLPEGGNKQKEFYANIIWPRAGFKNYSSSLLELPTPTPPSHPPPLQSTHCRANKFRLEIWIPVSRVEWKKKVTCWQLRDNQRNDEWPCRLVKVGRRSYGHEWEFVIMSLPSYPRCGSRLTALIMEALQMSDLGRQQKHPYLCTRARTYTQMTYFRTVSALIPTATL